MITIETAKEAKADAEASAKSQAKPAKEAASQPPTIDDPRGAGDAERFKGQPFTLFTRLERCMSELTFFKGNLRHRSASETSDPRSHDEWRRAACALARELADEIEAGCLEPNGEIQRKLQLAQMFLDEAEKAQRGQ